METNRMEYEIVTLEEKTAAGLTARTNNNAPDIVMSTVITILLWPARWRREQKYRKELS